MARQKSRRLQRFLTLRLPESERSLLQNLGRGRAEIEDRYLALRELATIVPSLQWPGSHVEERRPCRVGLPEPVAETIEAMSQTTGLPVVTVLLAAARCYRAEHPLPRGIHVRANA